jgi:hypothetical protein
MATFRHTAQLTQLERLAPQKARIAQIQLGNNRPDLAAITIVKAMRDLLTRLSGSIPPSARFATCKACHLSWQRCICKEIDIPPANPKPAPHPVAPVYPTATVDEAGKAAIWRIVQGNIERGDLPGPGVQAQIATFGGQPVSLVRRNDDRIFVYCIGYDSRPVAFWGRDWAAQSSAYKGMWKMVEGAEASFDDWWERLTGPRKRSRRTKQNGSWVNKY